MPFDNLPPKRSEGALPQEAKRSEGALPLPRIKEEKLWNSN